MIFDIWHAMTFNIKMTFDIWHLAQLKILTALILMILVQSYHIFTDGFWGYLQSKKTHSLNNIGLRDASASKNHPVNSMILIELWHLWSYVCRSHSFSSSHLRISHRKAGSARIMLFWIECLYLANSQFQTDYKGGGTFVFTVRDPLLPRPAKPWADDNQQNFLHWTSTSSGVGTKKPKKLTVVHLRAFQLQSVFLHWASP